MSFSRRKKVIMRRTFASELHKQMTINQNIILVTADLGFGMWDRIRNDYPKRFYNVGASEQAGADICVGMAQGNKIPFFYSITPFLIYRPFETLRTYINHENLNIKLIGSGRNIDYEHDGYSHNAEDIKGILEHLENIEQLYPNKKEEIPLLIENMVKHTGPQFLSLIR